MPSLPPGTAEERFAQARVGRLATVTAIGHPHIVPVCFALHGGMIYTSVDAKPKATTRLARIEHIRATGRASVLVDHYEEDWTKLWWVRVDGVAEVLQSAQGIAALAAKYEQYRTMPPDGPVIAIEPERWSSWVASGS